jgi:hypothetical protein
VREVLAKVGTGTSERVYLSPRIKSQFERAATLPGNEHLAMLASQGYVDVDVSGLRQHRDDDRVIVGFEVQWTEQDKQLLGLS